MLIEAAKGGHTNVVNLLLDWSANTDGSQASNSPCEPSQTSPSQLYPVDFEQVCKYRNPVTNYTTTVLEIPILKEKMS